MNRLQIGLLGGFEARLGPDGRPLAIGRKAQALLAYLAIGGPRAYARDKLAALLWGDMAQEQARHNLRQTLFAIKHAVPINVFASAGETVAIDPAAVRVDALRFQQLVTMGTPEALEQAGEMYRGDLLEGLRLREPPFEEWLGVERERLRGLAVDALECGLAERVKSGSAVRAVRTALRLLALDPARESVHRTLIKLYLATGQRAAALRQYRACQTALRVHVGVPPEPETRRLYEAIVTQTPNPAPAVSARRLRRQPTILVVEDEPVTRALVEGFLTSAGYHVVAVADGSDALLRLGAARPDLVVADVVMPTVDGLNLMAILGRNGIETPVMLVTGHPDTSLEARSLALGAADYLRKPIQKEVLLARVSRVLQRVAP